MTVTTKTWTYSNGETDIEVWNDGEYVTTLTIDLHNGQLVAQYFPEEFA